MHTAWPCMAAAQESAISENKHQSHSRSLIHTPHSPLTHKRAASHAVHISHLHHRSSVYSPHTASQQLAGSLQAARRSVVARRRRRLTSPSPRLTAYTARHCRLYAAASTTL